MAQDLHYFEDLEIGDSFEFGPLTIFKSFIYIPFIIQEFLRLLNAILSCQLQLKVLIRLLLIWLTNYHLCCLF